MNSPSSLERRIEDLVRRGGALRRNIAAAVATAAQHAHAAADGLAGVVRATVAGASKGLRDAIPADCDSSLRQVLDGLGDGLGTVAQAAELTLREAHGRSLRFAQEDLARLADQLIALPSRFVDSVAGPVSAAGGHVASQAAALQEHAKLTLRRIEPAFATAVAAARRDPIALGKETLAAGAAAVRGASGALFAALGKQLQALGAALERPAAD